MCPSEFLSYKNRICPIVPAYKGGGQRDKRPCSLSSLKRDKWGQKGQKDGLPLFDLSQGEGRMWGRIGALSVPGRARRMVLLGQIT